MLHSPSVAKQWFLRLLLTRIDPSDYQLLHYTVGVKKPAFSDSRLCHPTPLRSTRDRPQDPSPRVSTLLPARGVREFYLSPLAPLPPLASGARFIGEGAWFASPAHLISPPCSGQRTFIGGPWFAAPWGRIVWGARFTIPRGRFMRGAQFAAWWGQVMEGEARLLFVDPPRACQSWSHKEALPNRLFEVLEWLGAGAAWSWS